MEQAVERRTRAWHEYDEQAVANGLAHCPVMLVPDTSHSMWGEGLRDLQQSLSVFFETLRRDQFQSARIDIAAVSMGGNLKMLEEFVPLSESQLPEMVIRPKGDTPIGGALMLALDRLGAQLSCYRRCGISYVTPHLVMLSDGESSDDLSAAVRRLRGLVDSGRLICHVISLGSSPNLDVLERIAGGAVLSPLGGGMPVSFGEVGRMVSRSYEEEAGKQLREATGTRTTGWRTLATEMFLLDGANIIHWDKARSGVTLRYLLEICHYFDLNDQPYQVYFDASARYQLPSSERRVLDGLFRIRGHHFLQMPAGTCADDFLLESADGNPRWRILSDDLYRDHARRYPWVTDKTRVVSGMVLNDMIYFPHLGLRISCEHGRR